MKSKNHKIKDYSEQDLNELVEVLKQMNIGLKYDRGNFRGGLYRHDDSWNFYFNRKTETGEKIELIFSELNSKNLPEEIYTPEIRKRIEIFKEQLS